MINIYIFSLFQESPNHLSAKARNLSEEKIADSLSEVGQDLTNFSSGTETYTNLDSSMQKQNIEGSGTDQNSYLTNFQENLMNTCTEIIDSMSTANKTSEDVSKSIKIERTGSTEEDDWISGFSSAISSESVNDTNVAIKQELQTGKETFMVITIIMKYSIDIQVFRYKNFVFLHLITNTIKT